MTDRTFNNKTKSNLTEAYFYETRVMGRIPEAGSKDKANIDSVTVEVFVAFKGLSDYPIVTFKAHRAIQGSLEIKVLRSIDPDDFAALCEHYSHAAVMQEGFNMADEYQTEWVPQMGYVCVNANGLKVGAEDLCEVN